MTYTKTKRIIAGIALVALLPIQTLAFSFADAREEMQQKMSEKKDTLLIDRQDRTSQTQSRASYKDNTIVVKYKNDSKRFRTINIPAGSTVASVIKRYQDLDDIEYAEPDYVAYADMVPNDTYYSPYQWHLDNSTGSGINAEEAWDITTGSSEVIVAVIDTGIAYERYYDFSKRALYYQAPDLANTCFVAGYDFINNDSHPNDDEGHGTHVAGTIAQSTNNNRGVAGIAYNTCVMPVKALNSYGSGSYTAIANAIYYAVDHGADVINMSLGGSSDSYVLEDAVEYAYNNGVTVFAAAGNSGNDLPHYPSSYNNYVISVGATNYTKELPSYSNYGADVDIVAPGGDLSVDANGDGYKDGVLQQTFSAPAYNTFYYSFYQGTSMATPHAAGVAALLIANNTATTPDDIRAALETTAQDLGETGKDYYFANGLIDAAAALAWTSAPLPNQAPTANAGDDQTVMDSDNNGFEAVILDASASSDPDGTIENYTWIEGSTTLGTSDIITTDLAIGTHTITLIVTDNDGATSSDEVIVTIDPYANQIPTVNAGDDQTLADADNTGVETTTLTGSATDNDGTVIGYEWTLGSTTIATTTTIEVTVSIGTTYYTLTATDDNGATNADTVAVTVIANQGPSANAGVDQTINIGNSVSLEGSDSSDSDGIIESYSWNFGDENATTGAVVSHTYATVGSYTAKLIVTDNGGATDSDTVIITVVDVPSEIEVFYDSFEVSEWNGLWTEDYQNDWYRSSQRATNGSVSAEVDGRASNASLTSTDIDIQGKTNAVITFDWFIEYGLDFGEYITFDISTNGGTTWTEKARLRGNYDAENVWHTETIEVTDIDDLKLRFEGRMSNSREDANIDNIRVMAQ